MSQERDLILKAQADAKALNPAISGQNIEDAEERQRQLEAHIAQMIEQWRDKLREVREEAENELNQNEIREFQTRITVLMKELNDKNLEIEGVEKEKKKISDTLDNAYGGVSSQLKD